MFELRLVPIPPEIVIDEPKVTHWLTTDPRGRDRSLQLILDVAQHMGPGTHDQIRSDWTRMLNDPAVSKRVAWHVWYVVYRAARMGAPRQLVESLALNARVNERLILG